jgi:hypothetical protein
MIESSRRGFIAGLAGLIVTAPAIVKATSIMPVKASLQPILTLDDWVGRLSVRPEWNVTLAEVTRDAVKRFRNSNSLLQRTARQYAEDFDYVAGQQWAEAKIGSQLRIRLPNDFIVTDGPVLNLSHTVDALAYATLKPGPMLSIEGPAPKELRQFVVTDDTVGKLALAAAAIAVAPKVLETPVTRRFWGSGNKA